MDKRLGRYELRHAVGKGAAGVVWDAWDTVLNRRVAIKIVQAGNKDDPGLAEARIRFRQEAQLASQFSHPSVVQVYDYGEIDDEAFIVMEFVEGETLKAALDRGVRLPLPRVAEIMRSVLLALEPCHRLNIVHRDIKPSNIMLAKDGGVKLTDFGIAHTEDSELTMVGTVVGTPPYMSPEQFTGRDPVGDRSDLWSAAVVFYELLTQMRPFSSGGLSATRQSVVNDAVTPPSRRVPGLAPAFDQVVERALRKSPADRYPSAQAFWMAIDAAMSASAGAPPPRVPAGPAFPAALLGGVAAVVLLVAGSGAWWWSHRATPPPSVPVYSPPSPVLPGFTPVPPAPVPQAKPPPPPIPPTPAPPPAISIAARLAALPCSTVTTANEGGRGVTTFLGVIGSGGPRGELDQIMAEVPEASRNVAVQTFPFNELSCRYATLVRNYAGDDGARLINPGLNTLFTGDAIQLKLNMPDFAGEVRLEDLNSDGVVTHLMEANLGAPPRFSAGKLVGLGRNGDALIGSVSPPYGTDLVIAIISSEPLLGGTRDMQEPGAQFIDALDQAMAALQARGGHVAADALVLTTVAR